MNPLFGPPPAEVPLSAAPIERVVAQVRFPSVLSIANQTFIAGFQEVLRKRYPVLRPERLQSVLLTPDGPPTIGGGMLWRFGDAAGDWRLSLAPDFMALETTAYVSRADFLARLEEAVTALGEHIGPTLVDRFGLRYIDRVVGAGPEDMRRMVRPEVLGLTGTPLAEYAEHALSEALLRCDEGSLVARWGHLPPDATPDPGAIEPVPERSWILDVDLFTTAPVDFAPTAVVETARRFAERVYAFFRWAVTDEFLKRYGGKP